MELAILLKVMLRKGDLVEEKETTELPLLFPEEDCWGTFVKTQKCWSSTEHAYKTNNNATLLRWTVPSHVR